MIWYEKFSYLVLSTRAENPIACVRLISVYFFNLFDMIGTSESFLVFKLSELLVGFTNSVFSYKFLLCFFLWL